MSLLDRCIQLEQAAGEIYETLAQRQAADPELTVLWGNMARDERAHAEALRRWRDEVAHGQGFMAAVGFEGAVGELERSLATMRADTVRVVSADEAFGIALALESSELDTLYRMLLPQAPFVSAPAMRAETEAHRERLTAVVRRRSHDERLRSCAAMLAARDR